MALWRLFVARTGRRARVVAGTAVGLVALTAGTVVAGAVYTATDTVATTAATASAFSYSTAVTNSTPWAWWRFDDTSGTTTSDSSGNGRSATLSADGIRRGRDGAILQDSSTAIALDGAAGCVVSGTSQANPTTFSVEAWFRTTTRRGGLIVGFGGTNPLASGVTTYDRQVFLTTSGNVAFGVTPAGSTTVTSPGTYADGVWHHVVATLGAGGQKLYVDAVLVGSSATTGAANTTAYWHAGCGTIGSGLTGAPTNGYLAAELDEVAIYTTALSSATVTAHYEAAPPRQPVAAAVAASRPWLWWRLGETSGTSLADSSGGSHAGTLAGSGITLRKAGVAGGDTAIGFNGSTGCAVSTGTQANPQTFSLEAWFATTTTTGGSIIGFSDDATTSNGGSQSDRVVFMRNDGKLTFGVLAPAAKAATSALAYNDGAWHHVVATLGSGGQFLYVDGTQVATDVNTTAANTTGYWKLGCDKLTGWASAPTSSFLNGTIDEAAVYTVALDAPTIAGHYRSGLGGVGATGDVALASPSTWWGFDGQHARQIVDLSGNGREGWASNGGVTRRVAGVTAAGRAIQLDGTSGCVVASQSESAPSTFSVAVWFRTTSALGGPLVMFSDSAKPTATATNDDRALILTAAGRVDFVLTNATVNSASTGLAWNDGLWHQAVGVVSGSTQSLYLDGALVGSGAAPAMSNYTGYWHVGCGDAVGSGYSANFVAADVDEFAEFPSALGAPAVGAMFRDASSSLALPAARAMSGPWATWRLDETSGTSVADDTGNGHVLTTSASGTTPRADGVLADDAARSFNGTSGCAVSADSMADPQTYSIEAWFQTSSTTGGVVVGFSTDNTATITSPNWDRLVYLTNTGAVAFGAYAGSTQTITSNSTYNDGAWHQVTAVMGANGMKLYVDGVLVGTNANTVSEHETGWWKVGCDKVTGWPSAPSSSYFNGTLDEVSISTIELDAATIAYRHDLVTRPSLRAASAMTARTPTLYWKLDDTGGNATDSSGNSVTGTASGSGITRQQTPAIVGGTAWNFDGSNGCIVSSTSFANPTAFTLETWFRTNSTTGAGLMAFTTSSTALTSGAGQWDRLLWMRDAGTISFAIYNAGARPVITSTNTYNDGTWHHVAATVGTDGMKLYLDGTLAASNAATAVENFTGYWHAGCGKYSLFTGTPTNSMLTGDLDEVAVIPSQLSAETVRAQFLAGLADRAARVDATATVSTVIGTGTASSTGDGGDAASATINDPYDVVSDSLGNVYVAEGAGCRVRKIDPRGVVSTFAGTGTCSYSGDGGAATSAGLGSANALAIGPSGVVYVSDGASNRVRKIATDGTISTVAGTGTAGSTGDGGAATSAQLNTPRGLAVDQDGTLYIASGNENRVRKVTASGTISTLIGNGSASSTGDGGTASSATVNSPRGVLVGPDGSVYVTELSGCRVRKIDPSNVVTTIAGNGSCTYAGDGGAATSASINQPYGITGDQVGNLYVAGQAEARVRRIDPSGTISTILGTGTASSTGDGGTAAAATINLPHFVSLDPTGRLLVCERTGARIRRIG